MIYTTYFAKLRSLPKTITPIAICAKPPDFYNGLFKELKSYVPNDVGVYELTEYGLECVKKARLKTRERSVTEMLLMMFRSSNRDLIKQKLGGNK